ncbi:hypothetical protein EMCRGX_G025622 [Ephydatia muelleri]
MLLYPKPHRSQLLEGLRPTLMLSISHHWPGVSCSPLPQGLHQPFLPLQLKLKDLAVRQQRCPGQRAFHGSNAAREYQQVVTVNGQERAQHQLQLRLKHAHGEGIREYVKPMVSAAPSCQVPGCGTLPAPNNGNIQITASTAGGVAKYICNTGCDLVGVSIRICLVIGQAAQWSGTAPQCNPINCGPLSAPKGGSAVVTSTSFQGIATYACNQGFAMIGS